MWSFLLTASGVALCIQAQAEQALLNVYGEPLQPCGSNPGSGTGDFCTFRSLDVGAHQVCVSALPPREFWSASQVGRSWCMGVWPYSSYVLNVGDDDLPIKCSAIPSEVLSSQDSLGTFLGSGSGGFEFNHIRMKRTGIEHLCHTCEAQASGGAKQQLRRSCEAMWSAGGVQKKHEWPAAAAAAASATAAASGAAVAAGGTDVSDGSFQGFPWPLQLPDFATRPLQLPAFEMRAPRLPDLQGIFRKPAVTFQGFHGQRSYAPYAKLSTQTSPDMISICAASVIALSAGGGIIFAVLRFRRGASTIGKEQLLASQ